MHAGDVVIIRATFRDRSHVEDTYIRYFYFLFTLVDRVYEIDAMFRQVRRFVDTAM